MCHDVYSVSSVYVYVMIVYIKCARVRHMYVIAIKEESTRVCMCVS